MVSWAVSTGATSSCLDEQPSSNLCLCAPFPMYWGGVLGKAVEGEASSDSAISCVPRGQGVVE